MAVRVKTKVEPLDRDVDLIFREELSDDARARILRDYAQEQIDEALALMGRGTGGKTPKYDVLIDGRKVKSLDGVKADSTIVVNFLLVDEVLAWIQTQLQTHSPVRSGLYSKSHELFADGIDTENPNDPPPAEEFVFINIQPYSRKIERGLSPQAPDGVFQVVAALAAARFGNIARISFSYRTAIGGNIIGGKAGDRSNLRNPAIIVRSY